MQPYPPLQTLIAAELLRRAGADVAFFDSTFDRDFEAALEQKRPDLLVVCEDNFNFLTKMCLLPNRRLAFEMAQAAARRGIPALINSSDATDHPEIYLAAGFDCVIPGEVEQALLEICGAGLSAERSAPETGRSQVLANQRRRSAMCAELPASLQRGLQPPRAPIGNIDSLPPPAWDLVDIELYRQAWTQAHGCFSLNLVSSRGCPFRCNWCAKPIWGAQYRHHSPARVAEEMAFIKARYSPDQVWFADDIFGLSAEWTKELAHCVERRGARIPFRIQSRCDLMTAGRVDALRRAGCVEVWMGGESGSQRILDAMEKGIRVEQIQEARQTLRRHGIRACLFLQFGYLGEAWEDIEATIEMVRQVKPDDIGVSVSYPMPNTRFHQIAAAQMGAKANWSDSGELAQMLYSQQPAEFYRALADALHMEVRQVAFPSQLRQAWEKVEQLRCVSC